MHLRRLLLLVSLSLAINPSALSAQSIPPPSGPPMGWNSWNKFACDINEKLIRETADAMVKSGMRDAGYRYVNLDD